MQVIIDRTRTNALYTEGELTINEDRKTFTVEATDCMLPAGDYLLRIVKHSERKQSLTIFRIDGTSTGWRIAIGSSFLNSSSDHIIVIGTRLIPGAVYRATPDYTRLVDRFSKCIGRGEPINLTISDHFCRPTTPISHWLQTTLCIMLLLLTSCSTLRHMQVVEHASHDTLYLNKIQYDSIYIDNRQVINHSNDTVVIREILRENRYKFLKDTVRVVSVDSIPIIHEVQVTKTERYIPSVYKWSLGICIVLLIILIIYIVWKIKF